jgi:hypothetical protein
VCIHCLDRGTVTQKDGPVAPRPPIKAGHDWVPTGIWIPSLSATILRVSRGWNAGFRLLPKPLGLARVFTYRNGLLRSREACCTRMGQIMIRGRKTRRQMTFHFKSSSDVLTPPGAAIPIPVKQRGWWVVMAGSQPLYEVRLPYAQDDLQMGSRRICLGAVLDDVHDHGIVRQVPFGQAKPAWRAMVDCHLKMALPRT